MKKFAITLTLAVASFTYHSTAAADYRYGEVCAAAANLAVTVANGRNLGITWEEQRGILMQTFNATDESKLSPMRRMTVAVVREAHFVWANFEPAQIRSLAYSMCRSML